MVKSLIMVVAAITVVALGAVVAPNVLGNGGGTQVAPRCGACFRG